MDRREMILATAGAVIGAIAAPLLPDVGTPLRTVFRLDPTTNTYGMAVRMFDLHCGDQFVMMQDGEVVGEHIYEADCEPYCTPSGIWGIEAKNIFSYKTGQWL